MSIGSEPFHNLDQQVDQYISDAEQLQAAVPSTEKVAQLLRDVGSFFSRLQDYREQHPQEATQKITQKKWTALEHSLQQLAGAVGDKDDEVQLQLATKIEAIRHTARPLVEFEHERFQRILEIVSKVKGVSAGDIAELERLASDSFLQQCSITDPELYTVLEKLNDKILYCGDAKGGPEIEIAKKIVGTLLGRIVSQELPESRRMQCIQFALSADLSTLAKRFVPSQWSLSDSSICPMIQRLCELGNFDGITASTRETCNELAKTYLELIVQQKPSWLHGAVQEGLLSNAMSLKLSSIVTALGSDEFFRQCPLHDERICDLLEQLFSYEPTRAEAAQAKKNGLVLLTRIAADKQMPSWWEKRALQLAAHPILWCGVPFPGLREIIKNCSLNQDRLDGVVLGLNGNCNIFYDEAIILLDRLEKNPPDWFDEKEKLRLIKYAEDPRILDKLDTGDFLVSCLQKSPDNEDLKYVIRSFCTRQQPAAIEKALSLLNYIAAMPSKPSWWTLSERQDFKGQFGVNHLIVDWFDVCDMDVRDGAVVKESIASMMRAGKKEKVLQVYKKLERDKPSWWNGAAKKELFLTISKNPLGEKTFLQSLLMVVDFSEIHASDKETIFAILLKHNFSAEVIGKFVSSKKELFPDGALARALVALRLENGSVLSSQPVVKQFLIQCGVSESVLRERTEGKSLLQYLRGDFLRLSTPPLAAKVAVLLLCNDDEAILALTTSCSPQEKEQLLQDLAVVCGKAVTLPEKKGALQDMEAIAQSERLQKRCKFTKVNILEGLQEIGKTLAALSPAKSTQPQWISIKEQWIQDLMLYIDSTTQKELLENKTIEELFVLLFAIDRNFQFTGRLSAFFSERKEKFPPQEMSQFLENCIEKALDTMPRVHLVQLHDQREATATPDYLKTLLQKVLMHPKGIGEAVLATWLQTPAKKQSITQEKLEELVRDDVADVCIENLELSTQLLAVQTMLEEYKKIAPQQRKPLVLALRTILFFAKAPSFPFRLEESRYYGADETGGLPLLQTDTELFLVLATKKQQGKDVYLVTPLRGGNPSIYSPTTPLRESLPKRDFLSRMMRGIIIDDIESVLTEGRFNRDEGARLLKAYTETHAELSAFESKRAFFSQAYRVVHAIKNEHARKEACAVLTAFATTLLKKKEEREVLEEAVRFLSFPDVTKQEEVYCYLLIQRLFQNPEQGAVMFTSQIATSLGTLILLHDHKKETLNVCLDEEGSVEEKSRAIEALAHQYFSDFYNTVHPQSMKNFALYASQGASRDIYQANFTLMLANLLIGKQDGKLNRCALVVMEQELQKLSHNETLFDQNISSVLQQLRSLGLQQQIQNVTISHSQRSIDTVIKPTLGIRPDENITEGDMRKMLLIALLNYWRQKELGLCYVHALTLTARDCEPELFLEDVKTILDRGLIYRSIDGEQEEFLGNATSTEYIGKMGIQPQASADDIAAMLSSCPTLQRLLPPSVTFTKQRVQEVLEALQKESAPKNLKNILFMFCELYSLSSATKTALYRAALALTESPSMRMIESAYIALTFPPCTSKQEGSYLNECYKKVIGKCFEKLTEKSSLTTTQKTKIGAWFHSTITHGSATPTDPSFAPLRDFRIFVEAPTDGTIDARACVYVKKRTGYEKITNKNEFGAFLKEIFNRIIQRKMNSEQAVNCLASLTDEGVGDACIEFFDTPGRLTGSDAPWNFAASSSYTLRETVLQESVTTHTIAFSEDADRALQETFKWANRIRNSYGEDEDVFLPVSSEKHAFRMMPNHPSMKINLDQAALPKANTLRIALTQDAAEQWAKANKAEGTAKDTVWDLLLNEVRSFSENHTCKELWKKISAFMKETYNFTPQPPSLAWFFQSVNSRDETLQRQIIHFADSNYEERDVVRTTGKSAAEHFCFVRNPVTEKVELALFTENNEFVESLSPSKFATLTICEGLKKMARSTLKRHIVRVKRDLEQKLAAKTEALVLAQKKLAAVQQKPTQEELQTLFRNANNFEELRALDNSTHSPYVEALQEIARIKLEYDALLQKAIKTGKPPIESLLQPVLTLRINIPKDVCAILDGDFGAFKALWCQA